MKNLSVFLMSVFASIILFPVTALSDDHSSHLYKYKTDAEIIQTLDVINKNEIALANETLKKHHLDEDVVGYAKLMKSEHGKNLSQTNSLAKSMDLKPLKSKQSVDLQKDGKMTMKKLAKENGKTYEKDYIETMIKGHKQALDIINKSISMANNPKLINHLKMTKEHVEEHLSKAEEINKSLS